MKRFFPLLLVFLLSAFPASAQTHFITAGQTSNMIFTDYVPDYYSPTIDSTSPPYNHVIEGMVSVDFNHDGVVDCLVKYSGFVFAYGGIYHDTIYTSSHCYIYSVLDSFKTYGNIPVSCDTFLHWRTKAYITGDTLNLSSGISWQNGNVLLESNSFDSTYLCVLANTDTLPRYYFVKIVDGNDTALGYLHFRFNYGNHDGSIIMYDYAIEGPDSTIIINSTNDLSPSNLLISPNPFTSFINITSEKPFQFTICDYTGRVVMQGVADKTIETEALASGSYILTLKNEEMVAVKKMVKY